MKKLKDTVEQRVFSELRDLDAQTNRCNNLLDDALMNRVDPLANQMQQVVKEIGEFKEGFGQEFKEGHENMKTEAKMTQEALELLQEAFGSESGKNGL
jgi:hypothetical protein